jgi:SAM-dependent MidA family methyltransferase
VNAEETVGQEIDKVLGTRELSFAEFMSIALYLPGAGYYSRGRNPVGTDADFVTSPTLSPLFPFVLSRLVSEFVRRCTDGLCSVVDIGCGDGHLIRELARLQGSGRAGFFGVDQSLARAIEGVGVSFLPSWRDVPNDRPALVLSNELFDAFPFARLVQRDELRELTVVRSADGSLQWSERVAPREYVDYFASRSLELAE